MRLTETPHLFLCFEPDHLTDHLAGFFFLLQSGLKLKTRIGVSIETLLIRDCGIPAENLDRIQTVFLDGKAVDDLTASIVKDGSILALSAAMPGLVGATLRRGSYYAALRSPITAADTQETTELKDGTVTLKLFNLLIKELGPMFLTRGIWIDRGALKTWLSGLPPGFWLSCKEARINGRVVEPEVLSKTAWPDTDELIYLKVVLHNPDAPAW
jgi:hypothetical protein